MLRVATTCLVAVLTGCGSAYAADPAARDVGYGDHGIVRTGLDGMATGLPDGGLVVAGVSKSPAALSVLRFDANGRPTRGTTIDLPATERVTAVLDLSGGGTLVAVTTDLHGSSTARSALVRFRADGALDADFGSTGTLALEGPAVDAMALQAGGVTLLRADASLVRLDGRGALDPSFGISGVTRLDPALVPVPPEGRSPYPGGTSKGLRLLSRPDDGLLVLANSPSGDSDAHGYYHVAPYAFAIDAAGHVISTYGTDGVAGFGFDAIPDIVSTGPDGAVLAVAAECGFTKSEGDEQCPLPLVRLTGAGQPVTGFGHHGTLRVAGTNGNAKALALEARGTMLIGGTEDNELGGTPSGLTRVAADGKRDRRFGVCGVADTVVRGEVQQLLVQPSGRILELVRGGPRKTLMVAAARGGSGAGVLVGRPRLARPENVRLDEYLPFRLTANGLKIPLRSQSRVRVRSTVTVLGSGARTLHRFTADELQRRGLQRTLGTGRSTLAACQTSTATIPIAAVLRRALGRIPGVLHLTLTVRAQNAAGATTLTFQLEREPDGSLTDDFVTGG